MPLCKPTIRHGAKYRLLKRCIPVSTSSQHPATAASWRNSPPILSCPSPRVNAAFVKTAAFGLKRIAVSRWCFVNCWIVGCGRCQIGLVTRQSLKKESTESSSSITRTIGQSEKRAAPFRKPAKCERKTICLSERGNKPIKPYKTMTLRLNAAEYAHLCRQAEVTGLKKEPLVRQLIMGVNLRPRPPDAYADLLRALSAIGNNINQLAHQANARGAATGDEITEALHLVRQATRLVRERL